jgi:hypothetical protein
MSVQSEIDRINGNVANTYSALSEMGATMPEQQNSDNLAGTVRTVPVGGGSSVEIDPTPTSGSSNPVSSGGVFDALANKQDKLKQTAEEVQKAIDGASASFEIINSDTLTLEQINLETLDPSTIVGGMAVKVSDSIITRDDLLNGALISTVDGTLEYPPESIDDMFVPAFDGINVVLQFLFSVEERAVGIEVEEGLIFPDSGLYIPVEVLLVSPVTITINGFTGFSSVKINPKSLQAAHFYIDSNSYYLHHSKSFAEDNRVKMAELRSAYYSGIKTIFSIVHYIGSDVVEADVYPYQIMFGDKQIYFYAVDGNGSLKETKIYTAEYVPEET